MKFSLAHSARLGAHLPDNANEINGLKICMKTLWAAWSEIEILKRLKSFRWVPKGIKWLSCESETRV